MTEQERELKTGALFALWSSHDAVQECSNQAPEWVELYNHWLEVQKNVHEILNLGSMTEQEFEELLDYAEKRYITMVEARKSKAQAFLTVEVGA